MSGNNEVVIRKHHIIIGLIIVLLLLIGALWIGLKWSDWFTDEPSGSSQVSQEGLPDIDPNASDWNGGQLPDKTEDAPAVGIKIPGYPSVTIPANEKDVAVALLNPEGNPCYFVFELVLKENDEILYTSKLVPPGQAITQISLSRKLKAGNYDATIQITTYSIENQSPMNGANVETLLVVQ